MIDAVAILTSAYLLDLAIGDPRFIPHPVVLIGKGVHRMENLLRRAVSRRAGERLAGVLLVAIIVSLTWLVSHLLVRTARTFSAGAAYWTGVGLLVWFTATTLATRGLMDAACRVIAAIRKGDVSCARKRLAEVVGRDTSTLDEKKILSATIETLAENASDGIIAPLFWYAVGGLPLAMTYKAVNTLDSMLGYRNERYRYFGWAAARLDDVANFIPARLTAVLFALAALALPRTSGRNSLRTLMRDGRKHLSPNSGMPEAAVAGALGISLGGPSTYNGELVPKPFIGEARVPVSLERADTALRLMFAVSLVGFLVTALFILFLGGPL